MSDQDNKIAEFASITGDTQNARFFLEANNWDLNAATSSYLSAADEGGLPSQSEPTRSQRPQAEPSSASGPFSSTGPHAAPPSSSYPTTSKSPPQKKKFGSIRDLQSSNAPSDSDSEKEQEYFAGGDKSGLAVQDPGNNGNDGSAGPGGANEHIQRLLHTARQNRTRPPGSDGDEEDAGMGRANNFRGAGVTLGGEGAESQTISDPSAPAQSQVQQGARPEMVERTLHLWDDGFSVDDGELYRYDDPANARTLEMINRGSAPLDLMNVQAGQAVDVKLEQHRGEKYVRPKKKYRPFEGSGNRLGAPTPGESVESDVAPAAVAGPADTSVKPQVDASQPTVRLQIRLADGTRLPAQFNTTSTIGDVREFVERAHTGSRERQYVLATTFPTKELSDSAQIIGEMDALRRGGNVVQKWT